MTRALSLSLIGVLMLAAAVFAQLPSLDTLLPPEDCSTHWDNRNVMNVDAAPFLLVDSMPFADNKLVTDLPFHLAPDDASLANPYLQLTVSVPSFFKDVAFSYRGIAALPMRDSGAELNITNGCRYVMDVYVPWSKIHDNAAKSETSETDATSGATTVYVTLTDTLEFTGLDNYTAASGMFPGRTVTTPFVFAVRTQKSTSATTDQLTIWHEPSIQSAVTFFQTVIDNSLNFDYVIVKVMVTISNNFYLDPTELAGKVVPIAKQSPLPQITPSLTTTVVGSSTCAPQNPGYCTQTFEYKIDFDGSKVAAWTCEQIASWLADTYNLQYTRKNTFATNAPEDKVIDMTMTLGQIDTCMKVVITADISATMDVYTDDTHSTPAVIYKIGDTVFVRAIITPGTVTKNPTPIESCILVQSDVARPTTLQTSGGQVAHNMTLSTIDILNLANSQHPSTAVAGTCEIYFSFLMPDSLIQGTDDVVTGVTLRAFFDVSTQGGVTTLAHGMSLQKLANRLFADKAAQKSLSSSTVFPVQKKLTASSSSSSSSSPALLSPTVLACIAVGCVGVAAVVAAALYVIRLKRSLSQPIKAGEPCSQVEVEMHQAA